MKRLLILFLMLVAIPAFASAPSRSYTYTTGNIIQASEVTANEDNLFRYLTAGVDTYALGSITATALAAGAITSSAILDGTIVSADISGSAAIPYSKITLTGSIVGGDLAANIAINTTGTIATTATTTTSGLSVTGMVKDKDGDWPTEGQILVGRTPGLNWEALASFYTKVKWVNYNSTTDAVTDCYPAGITISNIGVGSNTVNWDANFADTNYCLLATIGTNGPGVTCNTDQTAKAVGTAKVYSWSSTTAAAADVAEQCVLAFGD